MRGLRAAKTCASSAVSIIFRTPPPRSALLFWRSNSTSKKLWTARSAHSPPARCSALASRAPCSISPVSSCWMNLRAAWTPSPPLNFAASSNLKYFAAAILPCSSPRIPCRKSRSLPTASRLLTRGASSLATRSPPLNKPLAPQLSKTPSCGSLGAPGTSASRTRRNEPLSPRDLGFLLARPHHRAHLPHHLRFGSHRGPLRGCHVFLRRAVRGQSAAPALASAGRKLFCFFPCRLRVS